MPTPISSGTSSQVHEYQAEKMFKAALALPRIKNLDPRHIEKVREGVYSVFADGNVDRDTIHELGERADSETDDLEDILRHPKNNPEIAETRDRFHFLIGRRWVAQNADHLTNASHTKIADFTAEDLMRNLKPKIGTSPYPYADAETYKAITQEEMKAAIEKGVPSDPHQALSTHIAQMRSLQNAFIDTDPKMTSQNTKSSYYRLQNALSEQYAKNMGKKIVLQAFVDPKKSTESQQILVPEHRAAPIYRQVRNAADILPIMQNQPQGVRSALRRGIREAIREVNARPTQLQLLSDQYHEKYDKHPLSQPDDGMDVSQQNIRMYQAKILGKSLLVDALLNKEAPEHEGIDGFYGAQSFTWVRHSLTEELLNNLLDRPSHRLRPGRSLEYRGAKAILRRGIPNDPRKLAMDLMTIGLPRISMRDDRPVGDVLSPHDDILNTVLETDISTDEEATSDDDMMETEAEVETEEQKKKRRYAECYMALQTGKTLLMLKLIESSKETLDPAEA